MLDYRWVLAQVPNSNSTQQQKKCPMIASLIRCSRRIGRACSACCCHVGTRRMCMISPPR